MNTRPTEFRRASDLRAQAQLDRMLAAQRAADAKHEAHLRTLPLPSRRVDDVPPAEPSWLLLIAGTVAVLVAWAVFALFVVGMLEVFAGLK